MKRLFYLFLAFFIFTACQSNTSTNEVYCKQETTKMFNAIIAGKPKAIQKIVSSKYKDATGLYTFETSMANLLEKYDANDETLESFDTLCSNITKKSMKSYTIQSYKETNKTCYVYVKVEGTNFKKIYLEDYSDNFETYFSSYKEDNIDTYNTYLETEGETIANQKILENACKEYFQTIENEFNKTETSEYLVRVLFKKIDGKYQIYKTELQI